GDTGERLFPEIELRLREHDLSRLEPAGKQVGGAGGEPELRPWLRQGDVDGGPRFVPVVVAVAAIGGSGETAGLGAALVRDAEAAPDDLSRLFGVLQPEFAADEA